MFRRPAIVYLIGYPGAGKYTIARELARIGADRGDRIVVVDNHHVNNTIFAVLDVDGVRRLPPEVWSLVSEVREAVLKAIESLSPPELSFVFTNVLVEGSVGDASAVDRLKAVAAARGSCFLPVRLICQTDELARRVVSPARRARLKWVDADGVRSFVASHTLLTPDGTRFDLDVTSLSPTDSARLILDQVAAVA